MERLGEHYRKSSEGDSIVPSVIKVNIEVEMIFESIISSQKTNQF